MKFYLFQKDNQKAGLPLEPLLIDGQLYSDRVIFPDGSIILTQFDISDYLFSDICFCEIDLLARTITPMPFNPPSGAPSMNPDLDVAKETRANLLAEGVGHLKDATREIRDAIKNNKITETLAKGWRDVSQRWMDNVTQEAMPVENYQVHFATVPPFYHDVELRAGEGDTPIKDHAMDDSGAGINLISPQRTKQLRLKPGRVVTVEGITPEESVSTRVVSVHVTLAPGVGKPFEAAIYPPLRKKTNADFLLGRPIVKYARDNKVEGF